MKQAAGYFVTMSNPFFVIVCLALFPVLYYVWPPSCYMYALVHALSALSTGTILATNVAKKGWSTTRLELKAAMQLVREERAAEAEKDQQAIDASKARLKEALEEDEVEAKDTQSPTRVHNPLDDCGFEHPAISIVPEPKDDNDDDDKPAPPKLRLVNGGG